MPDPLMVPVRSTADIERVGRTAAEFARAFDQPLMFVHVAHPDDDVATHHTRLGGAIESLELSDVAWSLQVVERTDTNAAVVDACSGHLTCMATSASPYKANHYVGSCAASLVAKSTAPVVLIGPMVDPGGEIGTPERVYLAAAKGESVTSTRTAVERIAHAFGSVPVARLTIDLEGVLYEQDYDDDAFDRPDEVHARMLPGPIATPALAPVLTRYAADGLLVVSTHARTGLAWICEGSVAFDAIATSTRPMVAIGPNAG